MTKKSKAIIFSIGPVIATLYILAWAFPAFSAIIAALVIGAAVTAVSYFAYKLYIKGSQTAERINNIAVNFEEEYLPEVLVQSEQTLGAIKETSKATTLTLKQASEDLHNISGNTTLLRTEASKATATVLTKFDEVANTATKTLADGTTLLTNLSATVTDVSTTLTGTLTDVSRTVTDVSKTFNDGILNAEVLGEKVTLGLRQSRLRGNYEQNIEAITSYDLLCRKTKNDCSAGMMMGSKKTAFIAKKSTTELACRFLDDNNVLCNIDIPMTPTEGARPIATLLSEDKEVILKALNLFILRKDSEDNKASLMANREAAAALAPGQVARPRLA